MNIRYFAVTIMLLMNYTSSNLLAEGIWNHPGRLTEYPSNAWVPDMAPGPDGHVHLVWFDDRSGDWEVYHKEWDGLAWGTDTRLTFAGGESDRPQVAVDPWGRVHVAWYDHRDGDFEIYYTVREGLLWAPDERLTFDPANQSYPSIAADANGTAHIVWSDYRNPGNGEIYYIRGFCGNWESELRLTSSAGSSSKPTVAAGPEGLIHVAWYDTREGANEVFYKFWNGNAWSDDERVSDSLSGSWYQNMAVDSSGTLHLVWLDRKSGNWEVFYRDRGPDGLWGAVRRLTRDEAWSGTPDVAVDPHGRVHVVWRDSRDGTLEIYYVAWNGTRWTNETRLTLNPAASRRPSVCVDGEGRIVVVYMDAEEGDTGLYWVKGRLPFIDWDSERSYRFP
jgi:hypothetical protein